MYRKFIAVPSLVVGAMKLAEVDPEAWLRERLRELADEDESIELKLVESDFEIHATLGKADVYQVEFDSSDEFIDKITDIWLQAFVVKPLWQLKTKLTDREAETIKHRIEDGKSLTETGEAMGITPQGVVAFMRSIKKKVNEILA